MKINDRLEALEQMMQEQHGQLAVTLPTHSVEVLLEYCQDRMDVKADYLQMRTRANYYEERYAGAAANVKRLEMEIKLMKKGMAV